MSRLRTGPGISGLVNDLIEGRLLEPARTRAIRRAVEADELPDEEIARIYNVHFHVVGAERRRMRG